MVLSTLSTGSFSIAESSAARVTLVSINVYDLPRTRRANKCMHPLGIGTYHTAIQIDKVEVTFGGNSNSAASGIYVSAAR